MADNFGDIIDLCEDYILVDHCGLHNVIIELNDSDSVILCGAENLYDAPNPSTFGAANPTPQKKKNYRRRKGCKAADSERFQKKIIQRRGGNNLKKENRSRFGDCPICFEEFGDKTDKVIASTKCGHVYCMECIEEYLKYQQRCPTCRQPLKGKSSYHQLYLNR